MHDSQNRTCILHEHQCLLHHIMTVFWQPIRLALFRKELADSRCRGFSLSCISWSSQFIVAALYLVRCSCTPSCVCTTSYSSYLLMYILCNTIEGMFRAIQIWKFCTMAYRSRPSHYGLHKPWLDKQVMGFVSQRSSGFGLCRHRL